MKHLEVASQVMTQYEDILSHKRKFHSKWAEHVRFYEGDQWPQPTDKTRNLPRPVFNVIQRILDHKVASVMAEQIKITYNAYDSDELGEQMADIFTRYSDTLWEELKQNKINEEVLLGAGQIGEAHVHYFFNPSINGGNKHKFSGKIDVEVLDAVNVFYENQQESDINAQQYVLITNRLNVADVRQIAKNNGLEKQYIDMIVSDEKQNDEVYDNAQDEVRSNDKVTVITKYYKKNGYVHFIKVCSGIILKEETKMPIKKYPIASMIWRNKKKSCHGVSDVEGLIPNQKIINFLIAMQTLAVQNMGFPKMLYNPNYLKVRPTNEPGQMIPNVAPPGEKPFEYVNPPQFTPAAASLTRDIMEFTKEMVGANENALGEQQSAQLNASAIMMLQKAASVPIESIKRRFYNFIEDVARIWEEMLKGFYVTNRSIIVKDEEDIDEQLVTNFSEAQDLEFSLKVDVAATTGHSEALMMQTLDKLFDIGLQTQGASGIDMQTYLKLLPKPVAPFKDRLLKDLERKQEEQAMMQQQQEQQMMEQEAMAQQQAEMQPPTIEEQTAMREQELKQRNLSIKEQKTSETEASQDVQTVRDSVPPEIQAQIDEWLQQGISNREILNRLMQMSM